MQSLSSQLARSVLDAAPDAMIVIDDTGAIRFANKQVSALFGYSHDDLIGRPVESLVPTRFRERHPLLRKSYIDNVIVRPMGAGLNLFALRRDGSEFPVEISLSPIDDDGHGLVAAAIRDVTDYRRIDAELTAQLEDMRDLRDMSARLVETAELPRMLEEILDTTIALHRADFGNIQLCDPGSGALRIVAQRGFSEKFLRHFASVDLNESSACGRALGAGERVIVPDVTEDPHFQPHRAIAAHEGFRAVQSTPIRGRNGAVVGMLSTHFRLPHRPASRELQLTDIYVRLASELLARVQDDDLVRAARDVADRANQAKSRFLATASHDLRQPLQTLALLNGTMRRLAGDATLREALLQQEQAIGVMARLLNALLDISKLESGVIKPDPTDFTVSTLFEELRQEFAGLASSKGLRLDVSPCDDSVHSDPSLVGQILRNLMANAIKYTRAGWVGLRCLHDTPACIRIEVLDTGIGIPADQLRYIYDEFFQVGIPANSTREGYGLGLSIVQRLVALLKVRLDVQSEVGRGSAFILTLPTGHTAAEPRRPAERGSMMPATHAQARVLLVEDDPAVLSATRMLLKSDGYEVAAALTIEEALAHARTDPRIDLLLTDYHLDKGVTGSDVVGAVRSAVDKPLKVVLMTGDTSSAIQRLPRDPLMRVVSKPVNADELLRILRDLMQS